MTAVDPFAGMSDKAVLNRAADHLQRAAASKHGSLPSKRHWLQFTHAMAEREQRQAAARWRAALRLRPLDVTWRDLPAPGPEGASRG
jgi:hypothetical protein